MDFNLNAEQLAYQDRVRRWVAENMPHSPKPPPGREEPPEMVRERYNAWQAIRAIAIWAARVLELPRGESGADPASAMAMARATAIEGYNLAIKHGAQIHGAIGVTEKHDRHLFARRAKNLGVSFGSLAHYHEVIRREGDLQPTGGG